MSAESTVKVLGKHNVQEGDQLVENVEGHNAEKLALGLLHYAINVDALAAIYKKVAKFPSSVGVSK